MPTRAWLCLPLWLLVWGESVNAVPTRRAGWYMNAGELSDGGSGIAMIDERPDAFTNVYLCCDIFRVTDNATVTARMDNDALEAISARLHNRSVSVLSVFAISNVSLLAGTASSEATLDALVEGAKSGNVDGLLCDYEPTSQYDQSHADAYASFLDLLAAKLHAEGLQLGIDVAGWGINKYLATYAQTSIDLMTSMSPTYFGSDIPADETFVDRLMSNVSSARAAIGLGSMCEDPNDAMMDYGWTQEALESFKQYAASAGVEQLDVWPASIDNSGVAGTIEWFVDQIEAWARGD